MTHHVYVIENPAGKRYIGISEDVQLRLRQHSDGVSKWTAGKGPWVLIWTSEAMSLSDARKLENKLKRQGRGSGFYTSIANMARTQNGELLNTLQAGFKYIENESFESTFQGLFSEINLGSDKLGKTYADRNAKWRLRNCFVRQNAPPFLDFDILS